MARRIRQHTTGRGVPCSPSIVAFGSVAAILGTVQRWWATDRLDRPERRYMRGDPHSGVPPLARQ